MTCINLQTSQSRHKNQFVPIFGIDSNLLSFRGGPIVLCSARRETHRIHWIRREMPRAEVMTHFQGKVGVVLA